MNAFEYGFARENVTIVQSRIELEIFRYTFGNMEDCTFAESHLWQGSKFPSMVRGQKLSDRIKEKGFRAAYQAGRSAVCRKDS